MPELRKRECDDETGLSAAAVDPARKRGRVDLKVEAGMASPFPGTFHQSKSHMEIRIKRVGSNILTGNVSGRVNTYRVREDGREFLLTRTLHTLASNIGIAGKRGILYVESDDNKVHHQATAPGGACGLNTEDEVIEGLSPLALRAVLMADQCDEQGEITISREE